MKKVTVYTDGACSGNPGPGGWGAILEYAGIKKELSGYEENTTNNRMELTAVIMALSALKETCEVNVITDSKYVCDSMNKGWVISWKKNGWKRSGNSPALNADLWEKMLTLSEIHKLTFTWIKGHNSHPENERCDMLAVNSYKKIIINK